MSIFSPSSTSPGSPLLRLPMCSPRRGALKGDGYSAVPDKDSDEDHDHSARMSGTGTERFSQISTQRRNSMIANCQKKKGTKEAIREELLQRSPRDYSKRREERLDQLTKAQYLCQRKSLGAEDDLTISNVGTKTGTSGTPSEEATMSQTCIHKGRELLGHIAFQCSMAVAILVNSVIIGFESDYPQWEEYWQLGENFLLLIFTLELAMRVHVLGFREYFYWKGHDFMWNIFDFFIVTVGVIDAAAIWVDLRGEGDGGFATVFRVVRLMRILRILRIVRFLKHLYMLAFGFLEACQAVAWVTILLSAGLYICSILLVRTVGHAPESDPFHHILREKFGTIPISMLTLFQLMSVPDLKDYLEVLLDRPIFACFLIMFIIFGSFGMMALLTGVISEGMFEKNQTRIEEERVEREVKRKMLSDEINEVFDSIALDQVGMCEKDQIEQMLPVIADMFEAYDVSYTKQDLEGIVNVIGADEHGLVRREEFCNSVLSIAEDVRPLSIMEVHYAVSLVRSKVENCSHTLEELSDICQEITSYKEDFEELRKEHTKTLSKFANHITELFAIKQSRLHSTIPDWAVALNDAVRLLRMDAEALTRSVAELRGNGMPDTLACQAPKLVEQELLTGPTSNPATGAESRGTESTQLLPANLSVPKELQELPSGHLTSFKVEPSNRLCAGGVEQELRCMISEFTCQVEELLNGPRQLLAKLECGQLELDRTLTAHGACSETAGNLTKISESAHTVIQSQAAESPDDQDWAKSLENCLAEARLVGGLDFANSLELVVQGTDSKDAFVVVRQAVDSLVKTPRDQVPPLEIDQVPPLDLHELEPW